MKKQYHFVLDTTNPREQAIITYLEAFKESRGMKSVFVVAFETYINGGTNIAVNRSIEETQRYTESEDPTSIKSYGNEIEEHLLDKSDNTSDIPDDILDLIDDLG